MKQQNEQIFIMFWCWSLKLKKKKPMKDTAKWTNIHHVLNQVLKTWEENNERNSKTNKYSVDSGLQDQPGSRERLLLWLKALPKTDNPIYLCTDNRVHSTNQQKPTHTQKKKKQKKKKKKKGGKNNKKQCHKTELLGSSAKLVCMSECPL